MEYSQIGIQKELCILEMQKGTELTINKLNDLKELKNGKKNKIKYSIGEKIMNRREEINEVKNNTVYDPVDKSLNMQLAGLIIFEELTIPYNQG